MRVHLRVHEGTWRVHGGYMEGTVPDGQFTRRCPYYYAVPYFEFAYVVHILRKIFLNLYCIFEFACICCPHITSLTYSIFEFAYAVHILHH